jgi:plasmid stabilization system protein ParE
MTVGIFTTPESDAQILTIDRWWRRERPAAPNLFAEELAAAFELLASVPKAGRRYRHPRIPGIRRILLRSTRYHVYYKHHEDTVIVLVVWSGVRGSGPALK